MNCTLNEEDGGVDFEFLFEGEPRKAFLTFDAIDDLYVVGKTENREEELRRPMDRGSAILRELKSNSYVVEIAAKCVREGDDSERVFLGRWSFKK